MHMGTSIRISGDTKSILEVLKDDDESWDEFLRRLSRRERDVEKLSGFAQKDGVVEHMEQANRELNESLNEQQSETDDLLGQ